MVYGTWYINIRILRKPLVSRIPLVLGLFRQSVGSLSFRGRWVPEKHRYRQVTELDALVGLRIVLPVAPPASHLPGPPKSPKTWSLSNNMGL